MTEIQSTKRRRRIDWNALTAIVSAVGLLLAAAGLFTTAGQIKLSRQLAKSEFMREFYNSIQSYNDIAMKLANDGEWRSSHNAGPQTKDEWYRLQRYMGLLEQIDHWYRDGIMSIDHIDNAYSHRYKAIVTHPLIHKRLLVDEGFRWRHFLDLSSALEEMPLYQKLEFSYPSPTDSASSNAAKAQGEQDGGGQPATRPESK